MIRRYGAWRLLGAGHLDTRAGRSGLRTDLATACGPGIISG
jgi:hypothetical protein